MKNFLILLVLLIVSHQSWAGCSAPISRTNNTPNQKLTSTKYNQDLNTVYSKVNNLSGDCLTEETITGNKLVDGTITAEKIAAAVLAKFIPPGAVTAYVGAVAPDGYLLCNGQAVSRTTYAELFAIIGTSHGSGNGSTTFNVPDYRGRFLRGTDFGAGRDPDRASRTAMNPGGNSGDLIGSVQGDMLKSHDHPLWGAYNDGAAGGGIGANNTQVFMFDTGTRSDLRNAIDNEGGNETRPVNANVNYIIKY